MDVLRLAIVLSGVESRRFDKILNSLVVNVFANRDNSNNELSVSQIQKELKDTYGLDFSSSEIELSLKDSKNFLVSKKNGVKYFVFVSNEKAIANPLNHFDINKCIALYPDGNYPLLVQSILILIAVFLAGIFSNLFYLCIIKNQTIVEIKQ